MKVKTKQELSELDEELNLFDESDWNFLDAQEGCSLEYFNDLRDDDFAKRGKKDILRYTFITLTVCCLFLISGVWLYNVTIGRQVLSDGDVSQTDDRYVALKRIEDGVVASDSDFIEISKTVSSYFNVLKNETSYELLNNFCMTSSTFTATEELYRQQMSYSYDKNDCCARVMRCFGRYFSVSKINEVLFKDDTYYIYADLSYPDEEVLTEYFYIYSSDMTKFFNVNELTEQNIIRYIIQLADTYGIPTSSKEVCFKMYLDEANQFVLMDDSFVTNQCTTSYNYAISQAIKVLGGSKAVQQYE